MDACYDCWDEEFKQAIGNAKGNQSFSLELEIKYFGVYFGDTLEFINGSTPYKYNVLIITEKDL